MPKIKNDLPQVELKTELQTLLRKYGQGLVEKEIGSLWGISNEPIEDQEISLWEAAYRFLNDEFSVYQNVSPSSQASYRSEVRSYCAYYGVTLGEENTTYVSLKEVLTPAQIEDYLMNAAKTTATRNKKAAFLRSFIKSVATESLSQKKIDQLFNRALQLEEPELSPPRAFTASQIDYLLNEARLTRGALRNYTIIWTLVGTGIRVDELHFQIGDVNFKEGWIKVRAKGRKTKAKVKRYMTPGLMKVLRYYIRFTYSHLARVLDGETYNRLYVFSDTFGREALSNRAVQKMMKGLIDKGIEEGVIQDTIWDSDQGEYVKVNYSTHSTRHSFAIYALESGLDVYVVKELLGHKSIQSTEVYLKLFDDQFRQAIQKHPFAQLEQEQLWHLGDV
jgi:integrase/recombinase XerD